MDKIIMAGLALALALAAEERECVMHKEGGRDGWRDEREAAGKCQ